MLRQQCPEIDPTASGAHGPGLRLVPDWGTPLQNRLLAGLPLTDYDRLRLHLIPVPLPLGWTVYGAGDPQRFLYFLTAGIVSRISVTQSGESAEVAVTGNEGVIGIAAFLGGESTTGVAMVTSSGYAYRLEASQLKDGFQYGRPLANLLLRYTQALIVQTGQIAVCNRHHSVEQRLCVWMLSCLDRLPSNELTMTQDLVSHMLGVRREGVAQATGALERAGLIHCNRGHIVVLDRTRLEARACECYTVVKCEYERLLPGLRPTLAAPDARVVSPSPGFPPRAVAR
jgi:CRP-like cAMP-binding protein